MHVPYCLPVTAHPWCQDFLRRHETELEMPWVDVALDARSKGVDRTGTQCIPMSMNKGPLKVCSLRMYRRRFS